VSNDRLSQLVPSSQEPKQPKAFVFEGTIRCVILNGEPHWSVLDTYKFYGRSGNPSRDWGRDKKALEEQGFQVVSILVDHQFPDKTGKENRATPVGNIQAFMRIAQVAKFKEWEPLRQKMAKLMADTIRGSIRKDERWYMTYRGEQVSHMQLMDAVEQAVWFVCMGYHYIEATDAVFEGLYERTRQQIVERIGLKSFVELENHQSVYALAYQQIAKQYAADLLLEYAELDFEGLKIIIRQAAGVVAPQVKAMSKALKIDIPTNLPLLASGKE
jgi:hypothetical protein